MADVTSPGKYFQYRNFLPLVAISARLESVNLQALNSTLGLSRRMQRSSPTKIIKCLVSIDVNFGMAAGKARAKPILEVKLLEDFERGN
jgi:hypothetical protein